MITQINDQMFSSCCRSVITVPLYLFYFTIIITDLHICSDESECAKLSVVDDAYCPILPHRCTVQELVTKHLDINAVPRRYFWELMSQFTDDELEREKLREFCTAEGQACRHLRTPGTVITVIQVAVINIGLCDALEKRNGVDNPQIRGG